MASFRRHIRIVVVAAVLLLAVWFGVKEGRDGFRDADTTGQRVAAATQMFFGVAALACVWALLRHRRWLGIALAVWGLAVTSTGILAPMVWGGGGWGAGVLGGAVTAIVASLIAWGALAHRRGRR